MVPAKIFVFILQLMTIRRGKLLLLKGNKNKPRESAGHQEVGGEEYLDRKYFYSLF